MKRILFLLAIAIAFVACKKISGPGAPKDRLKAILLGQDTLQLYVGQTRQVPITFSPSNYGVDSIKWKSSDTTVISISKLGLLAAKKVGISTITVSNLTNTISVSCLITVVPAPIDSLKLGLLAYYPFNNSAADSSTNGFNGVLHGVTGVADRFGRANSAVYFTGDSTSYITVNDHAALRLSNTDFSINVWVNISTYSQAIGSHIISKRGVGEYDGYTYSVSGYGNPAVSLGSLGYGPGGDSPGAFSTVGMAQNSWHMATLIYSLSKQQITYYIDGAYSGSTSNIASPDPNNNALIYIGKDNPVFFTTYFLNGSLDEMRIYNRKLSNNEISALLRTK